MSKGKNQHGEFKTDKKLGRRPKKSNAGRPTVMTVLTINKLEEAFALGCSDAEACFYADISKQTLYDYQAKFPEFIDRKEALKQRPILEARQTVVKSVKTNPELALKFLERKLKSEFATRQEHTGNDGGGIAHDINFIIQPVASKNDSANK